MTPAPVVSPTETVRPVTVNTEPTQTPKKQKIVVKPGDYLLKIARELLTKAGVYKEGEKIPYSVNAAVALEIAGENENIADHPNRIYPGQELDVPSEKTLQNTNIIFAKNPRKMDPNYDWTTSVKARKDEKNVEEIISQTP